MIDDMKDHYRSAKLLIDEFGTAAEQKAEERMLALMDADDAKGAATWMGIIQAIKDLNATKGPLH